ncbi:UNVERIFIED_CONTAM: protein KINESIN LIGHT CHAIN-RELATED 2 [Sesamum latifolium]|uniref:Protein KINESIN LIGHT CHAIN-RELATED 2 n=1 Tax=Sesamum latifolium TaxID=2727402 RepID=A0AAW2Y115_9LAMI
MRRASSKFLSHLQKSRTKISVSSLPRDFASTSDQSLASPSKPHLESCSKTQSLLFSRLNYHRLQASPSQNLNTLVDPIAQNVAQMSSRQRKIKERLDVEEAFESAVSIDEMLKAFEDMESCFDEKELGLACLKIGLKLDQEGEDPEKTLSFAQRALRILEDNEDSNSNSGSKLSLPTAMTLQLLGSSCFNLKRFSESLGYLNRANRVLNKLEGESSYQADDVLPILHAVQFELFNVKTAMGRREEALAHLRKALEIKEKTLEEGSRELVEVAHDRRLLGVIYTGLEDHEKALEQNQLSQRVLKNWGRSSDLLRAEIDAANMQIALGRISLQMQRGVWRLPVEFLRRKERSSPLVVAEAFMEISMQYEAMNEFETAISLLKRALTMLEKLPQEQHSVGSVSARIGWLLLLTGKVEQAIPYLEDAAERLKESFGSKHYGVGYVYNNLGAAYLELDRPQSAAQVFAYAKDIMDVSLGPHHMDSIEACQNLSKAYAAMGSYPLAINFQEKVVEGLEGHGPSAQEELNDAIQVLEQLKEKASTSVSETLMNALPLPQEDEGFSAKNPHSGISAMER